MKHAEWTDEFSIGHELIDSQHKRLLDLVNDVADAVEGAYDQEATGVALRRLCDYTVDHFATEEDLMDMDAYAYYDQHMSEHMECTTKALEFLQAYTSGEQVDMRAFVQFVSKWICEHILGTDQKLGDFLRQRAQTAGA
jgi:hemerythrin-like metal-binding protein